MTRRKQGGLDKAERQLDVLLCGLEDGLLGASDAHVASEGRGASDDVRHTRRLIAERVGVWADRGIISTEARSGKLPIDPSARRMLLQAVVARQAGGLPKSIEVAFSDGQEPTDRDVITMLEELVKLGKLDPSSRS
jgi:hypothetical protein